jgi:drug/metabolite transporter (DMT)-like permease
MRKLGKVLNPHITLLYFGLFSIYASILMNFLLDNPIAEPFDFYTTFLLVTMAFLGWVAQIGVTKALSLDKAGRCAALNYL